MPTPFHTYKKYVPKLSQRRLSLLIVLCICDTDLNGAAEVLNISISTANQHVAALKEIYSCHHLCQCVYRAVQLGHIPLQEEAALNVLNTLLYGRKLADLSLDLTRRRLLAAARKGAKSYGPLLDTTAKTYG